MEDNNRNSAYSELHKIIKGDALINPEGFDKELKLLKLDLECPDHKIQNSAISLLKELLNVNDSKVQDYIFGLLETKDSLTYRSAFHAMKIYFKEMMCKDDFDFTDELYKNWLARDIKKMQLVLKEVYENELSPKQQKEFLLNSVVNKMMSPQVSNDIRNMILDTSFILLEFSSITELNTKELNALTSKVTSKYVESISTLRDNNYDNWHRLWIFLIRYFNKKLHNSMTLTNKLLRVVEYAFRNPSVPQRIRGYDCWKELIDNASLDRKHFCSQKQIKLLVTPLRAKFSKQEAVICKRFEVFVYLLEKLQDDLLLILPEFLEFCFGAAGRDNSNLRTGQAKVVPEISLPSISAFIEIIGHSHENDCVQSTMLKLARPVISSDNIEPHYEIILHSVFECCTLLENCATSEKESIIRCIWRSVFFIVLCAPNDVRDKCNMLFANIFENFMKKKEEYYKTVLLIIFTELMQFHMTSLKIVLPKLLEPLKKIYFTVDSLSDHACDTFNTLIMSSDIRIRRVMIQAFALYKVRLANFENLSKLWRSLLYDLVPEDLEDINFLIWPLHHNQLSSTFEIDDTYKGKLKYMEDSERLYGLLLKELEGVFKDNPLICDKIIDIFKIVGIPQGSNKNVIVTLKLLASMLVLPDNNGHHHAIAQMLSEYLQKYDSTVNDDEFIKNLSICIERLLVIRDKTVLSGLDKYLSNIDENSRRKHSKHLYNTVLDLSTRDLKCDFDVHIRKILLLLDVGNDESSAEKNFKTPRSVSRSARIANLAQADDAKSAKTPESPLALRLFGKDLDTLSPLKVKGSQLNNVTPPRSKKIVSLASAKSQKSPLLSNEKDSDFVAINTEVKLDKHKLTDNQKEAYKRRREDIPALYQDLTQSSQDDATTNSNSMTMIEDKKVEDASAHDENVLSTEELNEACIDVNENKNTIFDSENTESTVASSLVKETTRNVSEQEEKIDESQVNKSQMEPDQKDHNTTKTEEEIVDPVKVSDQKKMQRMKLELKKLSMDIVGAEEFLSRSSKRKRIKREPEPTEEASQTENSKRKTIGTVKDVSNRSSPVPNQKITANSIQDDKETKEAEEESRKDSTDLNQGKNKSDSTPKAAEIAEELSKRKSRRREQTSNESTPVAKQTNQRKSSKERKDTSCESLPECAPKSSKKVEQENRRNSLTLIQKLLKSAEKEMFPKQKKKLSLKTSRDASSDSEVSCDEVQKLNSPSVNSKETLIDKLTEMIIDEKVTKEKQIETESKDTEQAQEDNEAKEEIETCDLKQLPKKGKKRKRPVEHSDDEDIIESSQESFNHVLPNSSASKRNSVIQNVDDRNLSDSEDITDKTIVNKDVTVIEKENVDLNEEMEVEKIVLNKEDDAKVENVESAVPEQTPNFIEETEHQKDVETEPAQQKTTQSQDTQTQESNISPVEYQLQLDLPKKPELTESEKEISERDTLSFTSSCLSENNVVNTQTSEISSSESPVKDTTALEVETSDHSPDVTSTPPSSKSSLPTSPVTNDTPNRTTELLNDTLDISPISSQSNDEECVSSTSKEDFEAVKADVVEMNQNEDKIDVQLSEDLCPESPKDVKNLTERSSRMLNMVNVKSPSTITNTRRLIYKRKTGVAMSPSTSIIKKLMTSFKGSVAGGIKENVTEEDILTFTREVPSPLAVPRTSILKRKLSDTSTTEDTVSPCAKRKRVNFSDPCTTSKKVFIKDDYIERPNLEGRCLFDVSKNIEDKDLKDLFEATETLTESEPIETEKSLEIENPLILRQNNPIYPALVDCKESVLQILKKVTSPMFITMLMNRLKTNNITTIGDLAKESEATINRYPFKVPVVANVYKALDQYYNKVYKFKDDESHSEKKDEAQVSSPEIVPEVPSDRATETFCETEEDEDKDVEIMEPIEDFRVVIVDSVRNTRDEFKEVLQRARDEKIPFEELSEIFTESITEENFAKLLKMGLDTSKITMKDMLSDSDFHTILKHFIDKHGLPKIFELLTDTVESSEDESIYFDCMIKHSIEKRPLSVLLEKRSLVEIRTGLKECIEQNMFAREDLIEICLLPLLKTPKDLSSYFSKLSVVQIESVIVERLQGAEFKTFVSDILSSCRNETVVELMKEKKFIEHCRTQDIVHTIIERWSPDEVVNCFKTCVEANALPDQQAMLIEMFKFASSRLSVGTLTELHIDFLRTIPKLVDPY